MPEPAVVTAMRAFKQGLLQREAAQMQEMAGRWLSVEAALSAQVDALAYDFDRRRQDGEIISQGALYRMTRYKSLLQQTRTEFGQYADWAEGRVRQGQETSARLGLTEAQQAIQLSYEGRVWPQFDRLPVEAVEQMVGMAGNGRPLGDLLRQRIAPGYRGDERASVWSRLTQELIDSTALGRNPRDTARRMRDALDGGLTKALVIARTEQLRVYRQASVDQYRASGVVRGQKRLTAHDSRVCAACIADEGTVYSLDATIPDHPQGRCTAVPLVDGMPEINWTSGEAWFRAQPEDVQRSILGPGRFDAWEVGEFDFGALVTPTYDETWGAGLRPTSLADLLRIKKRPAIGIKADAIDGRSRQIRGKKYDTADVVNQAIEDVDVLDLAGARDALRRKGHSSPPESLVRDYAVQKAILDNIQRITGSNTSGQIGKWNFSSARTIHTAFNKYLNRRISGQRRRYKR